MNQGTINRAIIISESFYTTTSSSQRNTRVPQYNISNILRNYNTNLHSIQIFKFHKLISHLRLLLTTDKELIKWPNGMTILKLKKIIPRWKRKNKHILTVRDKPVKTGSSWSFNAELKRNYHLSYWEFSWLIQKRSDGCGKVNEWRGNGHRWGFWSGKDRRERCCRCMEETESKKKQEGKKRRECI